MSAEETLVYESRVRNRQAAVAVVGGVLLIFASVLQLSGPHTSVDELTTDLLTANQRFPLDLIASVVSAFAALAVAWTLVFLYHCARARNDQIRGFIRTFAIVAGVLTAITGIAYAIIVAVKVHQFATTGQQTYDEATHLTSGSGLLLLQLVGQLGALLVAVSYVLVALQAMRVGLLPRWMGYLGMGAGALTLFQIFQIPVVQLVWLLALAYLFTGRWPSGLPNAWRTGRAEMLPSAAELRAQRVAAARESGGARKSRGSRGRGDAAGTTATTVTEPGTVEPAAEAGDASAPRTRSTTSKRKRKHRR